MSAQRPHESSPSASSWTALLVTQTADDPSVGSAPDQGVVLALCPAPAVLDHPVPHDTSLRNSFTVPHNAAVRARVFAQLGQTVQELIAAQQISLVVGRLPASHRATLHHLGQTLRVTTIARLVAMCLPFVRSRVWVAIGEHEVHRDMLRSYRDDVRRQLMHVCGGLRRLDRVAVDRALRMCVWARQSGLLSACDAESSTTPESWYPDDGEAYAVPVEHIQHGFLWLDFVAHVLVSGRSEAAQQWRETLQGDVREVVLTELPL